MYGYEMCPVCGNMTLARVDEPTVGGVNYICDECAAELDYFKKPLEEKEDGIW